MKEIPIIQPFIFSLICVLALFGCTPDDSITEQPACITIQVEAEDFIPQAATRVPVEEGYKTVFKGGEQIGITVIKDGKIVDGVNNICFTYDASTKKWTAAAGSPSLYYYQDVTYLAYYPYDAGMSDKMSEQEIIDAFTPQTDQSTYADYTKSDLMVATGTADRTAKTLSLPFSHKMALVSVSAVTNKFVTSGGYEYTPGEEFAVRNLAETSITIGAQTLKPCSFDDGTFRVIVRPDDIAQTINIKYRWVDLTDYTDQTQQTLIGGKYIHYHFKMPQSVPYIRDLQSGDYFFRDGRILPREASVITDPTNCVGIVVNTADAGRSDATYGGKCENNTVHGHILSVYDVATCKWGPSGTDIGNSTGDSHGDHRGYQLNQNIIKDANTNYGGLSPSNYAAAYHCLNYGNTDKGRLETTKNSGWYFPSEGFLRDGALYLKPYMSKLVSAGYGQNFASANYWDVSGTGDNSKARVVNFGNNGNYSYPRSNSYRVRAMLTF